MFLLDVAFLPITLKRCLPVTASNGLTEVLPALPAFFLAANGTLRFAVFPMLTYFTSLVTAHLPMAMLRESLQECIDGEPYIEEAHTGNREWSSHGCIFEGPLYSAL